MQGSLSDGFEGKKGRGSGSMKNRTQQLPFAVSEAAKTIARKFSGREKEKRNGRRKTALSRLLFLCREWNFSGRLDSREKLCYNGAEKQSRASCVKCRLNRELSGGRKAGFGLRCGARIPLLHNTGVLPPGRDPPDVMRHSSDAVS